MDRNLQLYYRSALNLKLPVTYLQDIHHLTIQLGKSNYFLTKSVSQLNNAASIRVAKNKYATNLLLRDAGFSVPKATLISLEEFRNHKLTSLIKYLKFPLVLKPMIDREDRRDVICNIKDLDTLNSHLEEQLKIYPYIQIEEYQEGLKEYHVLLLKNRVIGVAERFPASIIGDGFHSIETLIKQAPPNSATIGQMDKLIKQYEACLNDQGYTPQAIPKQGEQIKLSYVVNRAIGGRALSLGNKIIRENANYLVKIAKLVGLDLLSFDILCEDINTPFSKSKPFILQVNFDPDISLHEQPDEGRQLSVSKSILKTIIFSQPLSYLNFRFNQRFLSKRNRLNG